MGSTSETYENEANLVVYVANENAHLQQSQNHHQQLQVQLQERHRHHHYRSQPNIACEEVHSIVDDDHGIAAAYNVCVGHGRRGPSVAAVTVTSGYDDDDDNDDDVDDDDDDDDVAAQKAVLFDASDQNENSSSSSRDSCTINSENTRDHSGNNFDSCCVDNGYAAPVRSPAAAVTAVAVGQEPFVRRESVRSIDSIASGCSSLNSSSLGVSSKSTTSDNFSAGLKSSNGGAFNDKQTIPFSPYGAFPFFAKDTSSSSSSNNVVFEKSTVSVPFGWKRLLNNGAVIYISPSNTVLHSLEQVNSYLLTDGNCFCGLDCPLYSHTVFNFDPEVATSSLPIAPGGLSKQCIHNKKRNVSGVIPNSNLHQSCERRSPSSSFSNRQLVPNYCNPTVIKKYGFDISDRRKRKKFISSQDSSAPSSTVMVRNNCDISTKENNSVISPVNQLENGSCDQNLEIRLGMPDQQQLASSMGSMIRFKSLPNDHGFANQPTAYYGSTHSQTEGFGLPNECYTSYPSPRHNRAVSDQSNVYASSPNEFHVAAAPTASANPSSHLYDQGKAVVASRQQSCGNANAGQHHRISCGLPAQAYRMACGDDIEPVSTRHRMNSSLKHSSSCIPPLRMPVVSPPQFQQPLPPPPSPSPSQHQHHVLNQAGDYQPMRVVQSHGAVVSPVNSSVAINAQMTAPIMRDHKFAKQTQQQQQQQHTCVGQEKMDKSMYGSMLPEADGHACDMQAARCRMAENASSSFCNCYHEHENNGHRQQQPSVCSREYAENCTALMTAQNQANHRLVAQPPQIHRRPNQHHGIHAQKPSQQLYNTHHRHHQSQMRMHLMPPQQQQQQQQQLHHHHHHHLHQPQLVHIMQNQSPPQNVDNGCSNQATSSVENDLMSRGLHYMSSNHHVSNISRTVAPIWQQQKNVARVASQNTAHCSEATSSFVDSPYDRVPPLHHHVLPATVGWNEEPNRKKCSKNAFKLSANVGVRKQPKSSFQDVRGCQTSTFKGKSDFASTPVPSFLEDPSGYLAQQTALLNSTISKQTGETSIAACSSQSSCKQMCGIVGGGAAGSGQLKCEKVKSSSDETKNRLPEAKTPDSSIQNDGYGFRKNGSASCRSGGRQDEEISSSTFSEKEHVSSVPRSDSKSPIQAGTVSTSNQSPLQPRTTSPSASLNQDMLPQSPRMGADSEPTKNNGAKESDGLARRISTTVVNVTTSASAEARDGDNCVKSDYSGGGNSNINIDSNIYNPFVSSMEFNYDKSDVDHKRKGTSAKDNAYCENSALLAIAKDGNSTSTLLSPVTSQQIEHITKSPLEMVQNVVSSIQIPSPNIETTKTTVSQNSIQTSHFLVSNNGQLLVATSSNPQSMTSQQQTLAANSSMVSNSSASMTHMLPAAVGVTQQMLSQPTVLVNALPSGQLVFQPSVVAVDGAGNALQIPQLTVATANNVIPNQALADAATAAGAIGGQFSPRGPANLLSPESSKRKHNPNNGNNKKRKLSPQHQQMLQIAQQQNSQTSNGAATAASVVVQPAQHHGFAQPAPMLQTLILPNKGGQFANAQPLLATANVLQPVNLVHNIPTIQQFIVPAGLGGMVMANGDGTATLLPEAVQLNVLTPVQNAANVFGHAGNQSILTASPTGGVVIRTQSNSNAAAAAQLRPQTISTGGGATQFIAAQSPNQFIVNNSPNFNGQLSPIVASVSPGQQIHSFNTSPSTSLASRVSAAPHEYIQCGTGQTLMVPCSVSQNSGSPQNTTVVQQNTTIVQQQMTMVSNNHQQLPPENACHSGTGSSAASNLGLSNQHNIILNDNKQSQNFFITADSKSTPPQQTGYILSPKNSSQEKHASAHFVLNNLNTEKQSPPSFIISSPSEKQLCGNFILTNSGTPEKNNARGNLIIAANQTSANFDRQINSHRFSKHSVSTQTAAAAAAAAASATNNPQVLQISSTPTLIVATNNAYSQNSNTYTTSPPDTTTHSPVGTSSGTSPDTPSSSFVVGSTDDVASPTSSTSIGADLQTRQPMVHCISSSSVVDWTENCSEEKKINIVVDHGPSEIIAGIDVFSPMSSLHSHYQRRSSTDSNENISFIESSTFDDSSMRK